VTTLKLQLTLEERGIIVRKHTNNPDAYDTFLRGQEALNRFTKEANIQARQSFEKAIELDPQYATAYTALGWTYYWVWFLQWSQDPRAPEQAFELAQKAITLNDSLPQAHILLGILYQWKNKQHERAIAEAERAIALDPNSAVGYFALGDILGFAGRPAEGIELVQKAMRLNPRYPAPFANTLGWSYLLTGQHEKAVAAFKDAIARNPNFVPAHANLAVTYAELGREEEAQAEAAEALRITPNFSLAVAKRMVPFKDPAVIERLATGLGKAGLK
jgi:adenylate cyclase